jgi:hypothetical protein
MLYLLSLVSLATFVVAHGIVDSVVIDGTTYNLPGFFTGSNMRSNSCLGILHLIPVSI